MNFLSGPIFLLFILAHLTACSILTPETRYLNADSIALEHHFYKELIPTDHYNVMVYSRINAPGQSVNIYLEGDGLAWRTRNRISPDPTPGKPVALKLAVLDDSENVVYIARPCQYVLATGNGNNCSRVDWTYGRFSEQIVNSINQVVSTKKTDSKAQVINLIGYSGGGAIAVLLAARRNDVQSLRTIAANLDHKEFCQFHNVSPLTESLNAASVAKKVAMIPQVHFVGGQDEIIPGVIAKNFVALQGDLNCSEVVWLDQASHHEGWQNQWPRLIRRSLTCQ